MRIPYSLIVAPLLVVASSARAAAPPNIVVILADDFGVGDVQALHAGKVPTPSLDRLVQQGMRFTDAHSGSAVCTPTRYGLLTGRYAWRTRLQRHVLHPYEPPLIEADRLTLPAMLKQHGYHTACIGKWHLGMHWPNRDGEYDYEAELTGGPTDRGFDVYFGTHVPNYPPFTFIEQDRIAALPTAEYRHDPSLRMGRRGGPMAPGWRFDRILPEITRRAVGYIHERADAGEPFFLYFAMTSPHEPIAPSAQFRGKSGIAPIADFLMETDWSAGEVIRAIDECGVADETLVVFTADNGHSHYTGWQDLIDAGHRPSGPYRGHKGDIWEGGHRVPFVARWPGRIQAGAESGQFVCLNDLMATCAALLGEELPENAAEDSVNILPAMLGEAEGPLRESLVHHDAHGGFAIRQGRWKLIFASGKRGKRSAVPRLYDLEEDPGERDDVAASHPEIVDRLSNLLDSYIDRGRSTPGEPQENDVPKIDFRRAPRRRLVEAPTGS